MKLILFLKIQKESTKTYILNKIIGFNYNIKMDKIPFKNIFVT